MKTLSVVVPVYNAQRTLDELVSRLVNSLTDFDFEIILVDDSSTDTSWSKMKGLAILFPGKVKTFRLAKNFGQHNATLCGFQQSKGQFVVTIDDDLQLLPEEIPKLLNAQQAIGSDVVYGVFGDKKHSLYRNAGSYLVEKLVSFSFNTDGRGSSFRLIKGDLARKIAQHVYDTTFLDGLLFWNTNSISRVLVSHRPRAQGSSGYTTSRLIKMALHLLFNFTSLPLKVVSYLGVLGSVASLCLGLFFIARRLFFEVPLGFTATIVTVFFIGSLNLIALGIIGEYLRRVFNGVSRRPAYFVTESFCADRLDLASDESSREQ